MNICECVVSVCGSKSGLLWCYARNCSCVQRRLRSGKW